MKTIALAGSNSSQSINHQLVKYAAEHTTNTKVIKLTDYDIPMYSIDIENNDGIPSEVQRLMHDILAADRLILSVNEHNGNVSAYWKSILDWLSRVDRKFLSGKNVVLLSASPGGGGAASARGLMEKSLPHFGAEIIGSMGVPSFYDNFKDGKLVDEALDLELRDMLAE